MGFSYYDSIAVVPLLAPPSAKFATIFTPHLFFLGIPITCKSKQALHFAAALISPLQFYSRGKTEVRHSSSPEVAAANTEPRGEMAPSLFNHGSINDNWMGK